MQSKIIRKYFFQVNTTLILFLFLTSVIYSQSKIKDIKEGLELCYNFEWKKAEILFSSMIKDSSQRINGYHFLSGIYLWYYLGNRDKNDFNTFIKYSDQALEIAQIKLEQNPQSAYLNYLVGSNYMYRAIAFTKDENYLDAVWASKKSEIYLKTVLEIDPKFADAYLGLGLYNFAIGQIPSAFQWALSLAGIEGNKQVGIDYIKKTATQGNLAKVEAQYYLSQILSEVLFENEASLYYLKNLTRRYPLNLLFNYSYAVIEIKERNLQSAEKILNRILISDDSIFTQINSFANFLMGDIFFRQNQFDSAKIYYLSFLETTPSIDYTGIANYRLALCYELTNDRKKAEIYFANCDKGNMDLEDDQFAKRKGETYLRRTLSANEIDLIKAANMIESGKYQSAYDSLIVLLPKFKREYLRAEASLYVSEVAFSLGKFDESLEYALIAKEINPQEEKWIAPFASYYLVRIYKKKNDSENFQSIVEQIDDYSDYDYQYKLKNLLYTLTAKE